MSSCSLHLKLFAACVVNYRFHKPHYILIVIPHFILLMFYLTTYYPKDFPLCRRTLNTGCLYFEKIFCCLGDDRLDQEVYDHYSDIFRSPM